MAPIVDKVIRIMHGATLAGGAVDGRCGEFAYIRLRAQAAGNPIK